MDLSKATLQQFAWIDVMGLPLTAIEAYVVPAFDALPPGWDASAAEGADPVVLVDEPTLAAMAVAVRRAQMSADSDAWADELAALAPDYEAPDGRALYDVTQPMGWGHWAAMRMDVPERPVVWPQAGTSGGQLRQGGVALEAAVRRPAVPSPESIAINVLEGLVESIAQAVGLPGLSVNADHRSVLADLETLGSALEEIEDRVLSVKAGRS